MKANVAIIMVNYNGEELCKECIESINNGSIVPDIILVDNASINFNYKNFLKYKNVTILRNSENIGFTGGNNIGINFALKNNYEYIILLNNDTIIDKNMIEELMSNSNYNTITTPKMYYYSEPKKIWFAGGKINFFKANAKHIGKDRFDSKKFDKKKKIDFATGCCMCIHKSILEKVGLLNENFFMYNEDLEFCLRCLQKKIDIIYIPTAMLWHKVGGSSGGDISKTFTYYSNRNRFYLVKGKYFNTEAKVFVYISRLIRYLLSKMNKDNYFTIKQAYNDAKNGKMGKQVIIDRRS
ncbi:MAG: glycosyltransferase family 2 protein [Clostridia bacterium]|nr:glycosyltransferase family 2 protein [Clostridia bacterium]